MSKKVQSLIFDRKLFDPSSARSWAKDHGYKATKVDVQRNTIRLRQQDPGLFQKDSFRTHRLADGVQAVHAQQRTKLRKNPRRRNPQLTLYHASPRKFDGFRQQYKRGWKASDVGFHFGTKETALNRLRALNAKGTWTEGPAYVYKVRVQFDNVVRLPENRLGSWSITSILQALFEESDVLPEDMVDAYFDDEVWVIDSFGDEVNLKDAWGDEPYQVDLFRRWMKQVGIDAIVYENRYEHGGDSYIVFDPSQVIVQEREEFRLE